MQLANDHANPAAATPICPTTGDVLNSQDIANDKADNEPSDVPEQEQNTIHFLAQQLVKGFQKCNHIQQREQREGSSSSLSRTSINEDDNALPMKWEALKEFNERMSHCMRDLVVSTGGFYQQMDGSLPPKPALEEIYCGISPNQAGEQRQFGLRLKNNEGRTACREIQQATVTFDINSIIGIPSSLAVARQGISISFYPHRTKNISSNIHLTKTYCFLN